MLATGGSAIGALRILIKDHKVPEEKVVFLNVISCPEGLDALHKAFPKVTVITAGVDEKLDEEKYIVPGLGDFGDRYYRTS
jgi:uracil phosphoribosyltransferase